jgi:hypothetical protein
MSTSVFFRYIKRKASQPAKKKEKEKKNGDNKRI